MQIESIAQVTWLKLLVIILLRHTGHQDIKTASSTALPQSDIISNLTDLCNTIITIINHYAITKNVQTLRALPAQVSQWGNSFDFSSNLVSMVSLYQSYESEDSWKIFFFIEDGYCRDMVMATNLRMGISLNLDLWLKLLLSSVRSLVGVVLNMLEQNRHCWPPPKGLNGSARPHVVGDLTEAWHRWLAPCGLLWTTCSEGVTRAWVVCLYVASSGWMA